MFVLEALRTTICKSHCFQKNDNSGKKKYPITALLNPELKKVQLCKKKNQKTKKAVNKKQDNHYVLFNKS